MKDFYCYLISKRDNNRKMFIFVHFTGKDTFEWKGIDTFNDKWDETKGIYTLEDNSFHGYGDFESNSGNKIRFDLKIEFNFIQNGALYAFGDFTFLDTANNNFLNEYTLEVLEANSTKISNELSLFFIDKINNISREINEVSEKNKENFSTSEENKKEIEDSKIKSDELSKSQDDLLQSISSFKENKEELENLIKSINEKNKEISLLCEKNEELKNNLEKTSEEAATTSKEAKDALEITTTMSLARSFKHRKDEAKKSARLFSLAFYLLSILSALSMFLIFFFHDNNLNKGTHLIEWIERLPIIVFLVWIVYFSSKKSSQQYALTEFYAQKQALAESYQGYKDQIDKFKTEDKSDLELLMQVNLISIERDSSEVFERSNREQHSPINDIISNIKDIVFKSSKQNK